MSDSHTLKPGDRVDRFQVVEQIGEGGIARVYKVRHLALGTEYALKVLSQYRPDLLDRMLQEGRVQARIRHPNVVSVSDIVEEDGTLGLVMEYVDGVSLEHLMAEQGAFALDEALRIIRDMLSGVAAAHAAGALHRDLKPANILMAQGPQGWVPKITDFGIAKVFDSYARLGRTRAKTMMGTPGYVAPEQWTDSASVDVRADVFSLGVILYEMIAGRRPFQGDTAVIIFGATTSGHFTPLEQLRPECPHYVSRAVERAIQAEPEDRFSDVPAFLDALSPSVPALPPPPSAKAIALAASTIPPDDDNDTSGVRVLASEPPLDFARLKDEPTQVPEDEAPVASGRSRWRTWLIALGLLVLFGALAAVAIIGLFWGWWGIEFGGFTGR